MENTTSFDPFQQSITLLDREGFPFNVSLIYLDEFRLYGTQECIAMGTQIGACAILLIVLLLLTKAEKRTSPIFVLNILALILNIIRSALDVTYWTGPWAATYAYLGQDYSHVHTTDVAQQVTSGVMTTLLQMSVETSLCIQTYVVCITVRRLYKQAILAMSILISLAALGVQLALLVKNTIDTVHPQSEAGLYSLVTGNDIMITVCISWFCLIFVGKLGVALYERRKLGMKQFGPMQIIFIMGCQTLIIPVIFCAISFYVGANLASFILTAVALSLPLSSLWASASLDGRFRQSKQNNFSPPMIGSHGNRPTGPNLQGKEVNRQLSPADTSTTHVTSSELSPRGDGQYQAFEDLEAQGLAGTGDFRRDLT